MAIWLNPETGVEMEEGEYANTFPGRYAVEKIKQAFGPGEETIAARGGTQTQPSFTAPITPTSTATQPIQNVPPTPIPETTIPEQPAPTAPVMPAQTQTTVGTSVTPGFKPSATVTKQMEDAMKKEEGAIKALGEVEKQKAGIESAYFNEVAEQQKLNAIKTASAEERRKLEQDVLSGNIKEAMEDAANAKVDPNKFYKDRGTLATIGAGIAMALGAYSAAMTGGRNTAMDIIDGAIEHDINAQKVAIGQKQQKVQDLKGNLQDMRVRFGDERMAEAAAYAQQYQVLENGLKARLANLGNATAVANMEKLLGEVAGKKSDYLMRLEQLGQDKVVQNVQNTIQTGNTTSAVKTLQEKVKIVKEYKGMYDGVLSAFDASSKVGGIAGNLPGWMPGTKQAELDANNASIAALVIGKVPGIKSDQDFQKIIVPLLPKATDNERTLKYKRSAVRNFMMMQAPAEFQEALGLDKEKAAARKKQLGLAPAE